MIRSCLLCALALYLCDLPFAFALAGPLQSLPHPRYPRAPAGCPAALLAFSAMSVDSAVVAKVAQLARLALDPDQVPALLADLNRILGLVEQLNGANLNGVAPMLNPLDAGLRLRADVVTAVDQSERFQALAPQASAGLYLVPKVVE